MIDSLNKNKCTGCSACYNICPKDAIIMKKDKAEFLFPEIEYNKCIKCNLCEKVCPSMSKCECLEDRLREPIVKAAWSKDENIRINSTSGGLFSELAKGFMKEKETFVVGAIYNKEFLVEHYITNQMKDLELLRQSKYVQSDKKNVFSEIKNLLNKNKRVLFVGAPCEVMGLYSFLRKKYENLYTIDFLCLGTNSPKVYRKFLETLKEKYNSKVKKVWFKNKTYGWNLFSTKVEFENGKSYLKDRKHDYFMRGYIGKNKFYIRECCIQCQYKGFPRIADISLGDFWGLGRKYPELDQDKGTSVVLINSEKGKFLYENILDNINSYDKNIDDALLGNFALMNSPKLDERVNDFYIDIDRMPFDDLINKYCKYTIREKLRLIKSDIKKILGIKEYL